MGAPWSTVETATYLSVLGLLASCSLGIAVNAPVQMNQIIRDLAVYKHFSNKGAAYDADAESVESLYTMIHYVGIGGFVLFVGAFMLFWLCIRNQKVKVDPQ